MTVKLIDNNKYIKSILLPSGKILVRFSETSYPWFEPVLFRVYTKTHYKFI